MLDRSALIQLYRSQLQLCRQFFPGMTWRRREWGLEGILRGTEYRVGLKEKDWLSKPTIGWYGFLSLGMMAPCITPLAQGLTLEDCLQFLSLAFAYEQNLRNYILTGDRTLCKPFNYVLFHLYSNADKGWFSYSYFVNNEGPVWSKKSEAKVFIHFGVEGDEGASQSCKTYTENCPLR
jgi:hypothetical protein